MLTEQGRTPNKKLTFGISNMISRALSILASVYLGISVLCRIVLWISFGPAAGVSIYDLGGILLVGLINDCLELLYLFLPLSLLSLIFPPRWYRSHIFQKILAVGLYIVLFGLLYLQPAEYFFFDEFDSRFNLVAVDYLMYPHEVFVNLWESFPIIWFIIGTVILAFLLQRTIWPKIVNSFNSSDRTSRPWKRAVVNTVLVILMAKFYSTGTLGYSSNRVTNELSANGISSFFNALRTDELDYNLYYSTLPKQEAYETMRSYFSSMSGKLVSADPFDLTRSVVARDGGLGKMNVVILSEESFGAGFVGAYGDSRGLTPNFDRLSTQGLLFKNAFATGTRTVRGLEAISTSFPPIPSESIVKRPGNENIANWGEVLKRHGYTSSFIYGGFGLFDNMNYFFGKNGFELSDRTDIKNQTFANIWGVCDEDLFRHAISYFDDAHKSGKPFFSIVMTTSNHKPYTFPSGIPGVPQSGGGRDAGIRYADYAIGKFFEEAPSHEWYKNTIIIVIADHDARVYGRALIPIERYRIPLLVMAPGKIAPQVANVRISQIDLMPTVIGMLGLSYSGPFYGVDVLDPRTPADRSVLVSHNHNVAIFNGSELSVLGLQKEQATYSYDSTTNAQVKIDPNPEELKVATAYFQTAFDMFKNHKYVMQ